MPIFGIRRSPILPMVPATEGAGNMPICSHLEDYEAQYKLAEAAYRQCVRLVDAVMAEGPGNGRAQLVTKAIEDWRQLDERLRSLLVELVKNGRVRVPRRMTKPGPHRHGAGTQGSIICATCHRALPRLKYTDWQFAHNGVVTYRGRDFPVRQPVPR
jgi:hypothetical protein